MPLLLTISQCVQNDKLNPSGIVKQNTYVNPGDVIIGKTIPYKKKLKENSYKDNSIVLKNLEENQVNDIKDILSQFRVIFLKKQSLDPETYQNFAKSLGVGNYTILFRHVLPNIILPVSTMVGILYGYLLGGTILVEYVYAWPGIGKYAIDSINSSDYSPVMAIVMLSAISYLIVYLIMDIFHFFIDPRSR